MSRVEVHYRTITGRWRSARGDVRQNMLKTSDKQLHLVDSDHAFPVTTPIRIDTYQEFLDYPQPAAAVDYRKQRVIIEDDCPIPLPVGALPTSQEMGGSLDRLYETAFQENAVAKASRADLANTLMSGVFLVLVAVICLMAGTAAFVVISTKMG